MSDSAPGSPSRSQIPAVERVVDVLRHISERGRPIRAASLARALGIPRSSAYHLLAALEQARLVVSYPDDHTWGLGVGLFELGQAYLRQLPFERVARPVLRSLADEVGESAHLAVLHGTEVLYIVKEVAASATPLVTEVGIRLPAHLTATGRAMLATVSAAQLRALFPARRALANRTGKGPYDLRALCAVLEVERERGWALERGEVTDGIASIAVVVNAGEGDGRSSSGPSSGPSSGSSSGIGVPAAVGVSAWEPRLIGSSAAVAAAVSDAAVQIGRALRGERRDTTAT